MITPAFSLTATERVLPKLTLDFTTASLDSRITFTRTTGASNPATYVNSSGYVTAATDNQPRFDYNPTTSACKGLLVEESRANLATYSEDFGNAVWGKAACSVSTDQITSPSNTLTGDKLVEGVTAAGKYVYQTLAIAANATYSFSVYLKAGERTTASIYCLNSSTGAGAACDINLSAGTITAPSGVTGTPFTSLSSAISPAGNSWYRCTLNFTTVGGAINLQSRVYINSTSGYTGNGTSGIYAWGAQLELGAFGTSYIPTTSTSLTRNADVAVMTGANFSDWYSAGLGGLSVIANPKSVSGTKPAIQFDDTTTNELIVLRGNTTNPELYIVDGGAAQAQIDAGTIAANTTYNLTGAWATNSCAASVNGGAAGTDSSATMPTVTQARLGCDGTNYLNGWLQTVRYWPQRITNAETQAFSK